MNVDAYPIDPEKLAQYQAVSQNTTLENFVIYSCQSLALLDPTCDTFYNVYISTTHPEIGMVYIYHNDQVILAVFADSEEDVWTHYDAYLELFMGRDPEQA